MIPSPNGELVAIFSHPTLTIRSLQSLQTTNVVKIPSDLSGPVTSLLWSPSSTKVLIASADQIHVFSINDPSYHAVVRNPVPSAGGKPPLVQFGAVDTEVLVCSTFGLKLIICDLRTGMAVDIGNPKFYNVLSFARGYSLRPATAHLALLTRVGGKDMVSVHHPQTRQVQRSWSPETHDAQAVVWTPDGRWLLLWESPAHGRRILLYTPDGQLFRVLEAKNICPGEDADLEAGIKLCNISPDTTLCAVCDHSRRVTLLSTETWRNRMQLVHPSTIVPKDTLQVWQEQLDSSSKPDTIHSFHRATQMFSPAAVLSDTKLSAEPKQGCSMAAFDSSSTLLATRLDDSASTIWIWDTNVGELRAVLTFHSPVSFHWHPRIRETMLLKSQDEGRRGLFYVWDPLSNGPSTIAMQKYLSGAKTIGKPNAFWVHGEVEPASLLLSNPHHGVLLSLSHTEQHPANWNEADESQLTNNRLEGSFMDDKDLSVAVSDETDASVADDTFSFKQG
ncbi:WD repeat-containing protein [Paramyrothecium foliicola]|nr:WD repeat-containing protein [Paramyrothecium foliicola]